MLAKNKTRRGKQNGSINSSVFLGFRTSLAKNEIIVRSTCLLDENVCVSRSFISRTRESIIF